MKILWTRRRKRNIFAAGLLDLQDLQITIILPSLEYTILQYFIRSVMEEAFFTFQEIKLCRFHLKCGRFARCKCLHSRVDTIGLSVCANQYTRLRVCVYHIPYSISISLCVHFVECYYILGKENKTSRQWNAGRTEQTRAVNSRCGFRNRPGRRCRLGVKCSWCMSKSGLLVYCMMMNSFKVQNCGTGALVPSLFLYTASDSSQMDFLFKLSAQVQ